LGLLGDFRAAFTPRALQRFRHASDLRLPILGHLGEFHAQPAAQFRTQCRLIQHAGGLLVV